MQGNKNKGLTGSQTLAIAAKELRFSGQIGRRQFGFFLLDALGSLFNGFLGGIHQFFAFFTGLEGNFFALVTRLAEQFLALGAGLFDELFGLLAGFFSRIVAPRSEWLRLPAFTGWGYSRHFPRPAIQRFRDQFQERSEKTKIADAAAAVSTQAMPDLTPSPSPTERDESPLGVERFAAEVEALGGRCIRCTEAEIARLIVDFLKERGIDHILAWEDAHLPKGLGESLRSQGIRVCHQPDPDLRAGLTGALAGIADTGTCVLPGGAGKPHSASLLPEIHIAILHSQDILPDLPQALKLPAIRQAAASVLISGPSRTADIEMTLTIGVHGPGELIVFCLESSNK